MADTINKKILIEIEAKTVGLKADVVTLTKSLEDLKATKLKLEAANEQETKSYQDNASQIRILKSEILSLNKEIDNSVKAITSSTGSLAQNQAAVKSLSAERIRLGQQSKLTAEQEKKLTDQTLLFSQAASKAEQAGGNFGRNVGNYKSGFNGLANSINQVAREMPNFAQSATIGFMALSNNLPILADEIQRVRVANEALKASGEATIPVWKQIAKSIFSWQSALITLISLSVIYSKEISAMITGHKTLTAEQQKAAEMAKGFSIEMQIQNQRADNLTESMAKLNKQFERFNILQGDISDYKSTEEILGIIHSKGNLAVIATRDLNTALSQLKKELENISPTGQPLSYIEGESEESLKKRQEESYKLRKKFLLDNIALLEGYLKTKKDNSKKEAHDKDMIKLEREIRKTYIELTKEGMSEELALENEAWNNETEDLRIARDKLGKTDLEGRAKYNNLIEIKEEEHQQKLLDIKYKWINLNQKLQETFEKGQVEQHPEANQVYSPENDPIIKNILKRKQHEDKLLKEWMVQEISDDLEIEKLNKDAKIQMAQETSDAVFNITKQRLQNESEAKIKALEEQRDIELSNQNLTTAQKIEINKKYQTAILNEKVKIFKQEKAMAILQATINGALAITKVMSQTGVYSALAVPFTVAATALEIATIAAQQPPKYAKGGVHKSDGKGGALPGYSKQDNINATLRSGEGILVSEAMQVPWARNLASAINTTFGGRDFSTKTSTGFATGGIFTDGGNANRFYAQPVVDAEGLANSLAYQMMNNFPPVLVDVKDINREQGILIKTFDRVNF